MLPAVCKAPELEVRDLTCRFGAAVAVDRATFRLEPGEGAVLVGANGSGKTTLLRAILGLHAPAAGDVLLGGRSRRTAAQSGWFKSIAWMPQSQRMGRFPIAVADLLAASHAPAAACEAAVGLGLGQLLHQPVQSLSGGQRQRAFLARALGCVAGGAGLLLADEPTAALDFDGQEQVWELLAGLQATVLVVTHDQSGLRRFSRVLEMAAGRLRDAA